LYANTIITCGHVIKELIDAGKDVYANFQPQPSTVDIDLPERLERVKFHPNAEVDLALLQFADKEAVYRLKRPGLILAEPGKSINRSQDCSVISYPGRKDDAKDTRELRRTFGDRYPFGSLRYSPGLVDDGHRDPSNPFASVFSYPPGTRFPHDCTVRNYSDGAPVLDDEFRVMGVHVGPTADGKASIAESAHWVQSLISEK